MSPSPTSLEGMLRRRSSKMPSIDLLVVDHDAADPSGSPSIARGLSIKLSPPEEEFEDQALLTQASPGTQRVGDEDSQPCSSKSSNRAMGGLMDTDIPIPCQAERLGDLNEVSNMLKRQPAPLHRTESRLPSLEHMLRDETLSKALYENAQSPLLAYIFESLKERDPSKRLRNLQDMLEKQHSDVARTEDAEIVGLKSNPSASMDLRNATFQQKQAVIDTFVLFVKQHMGKIVEFWRATLDDKDCYGWSDEELDERLVNGPFEYCVLPWAFVSKGLKILRNWCNNVEVQQLLHDHRLADVLVQRRRLISAAYTRSRTYFSGQGLPHDKHLMVCSAHDSPFVEEVSKGLLRSVFTFISNLMSQNDGIRLHLWPIMWPECYWNFLLIGGEKFFDSFCLLMHNHITPLVNPAGDPATFSLEGLDVSRDAAKGAKALEPATFDSQAVRELQKDLFLMSLTEEEAALRKAGSKDVISENLINLFAVLLGFVMQKHRQRSLQASAESAAGTDEFSRRKGRLVSVLGRSIQEEAVGEDWFALFLLRIVSLGRGHSLRLLINGLLTRTVASSSVEGPGLLRKVVGCPSGVSVFLAHPCYQPITKALQTWPETTELVAVILYALAEYASVPDEPFWELQKHEKASSKKSEDKSSSAAGSAGSSDSTLTPSSGKLLGRKWNLVRRSFLTLRSIDFVTVLLVKSIKVSSLVLSMEAQGHFSRLTEWRANAAANSRIQELEEQLSVPEIGSSADNLLRPLCKCLISMALAPELQKCWNDHLFSLIYGYAAGSILDVAPFMAEYVITKDPKTQQEESSSSTPYLKILDRISPRDNFILVAALAQSTDFHDILLKKKPAEIEEFVNTALQYSGTFQPVDVGCEQAALLALKSLSSNSTLAGIIQRCMTNKK